MSDAEFPLAEILEWLVQHEISPAEAAAELSALRRMYPSPRPVDVPEEFFRFFPEHQHALLREFVRCLPDGAAA